MQCTIHPRPDGKMPSEGTVKEHQENHPGICSVPVYLSPPWRLHPRAPRLLAMPAFEKVQVQSPKTNSQILKVRSKIFRNKF